MPLPYKIILGWLLFVNLAGAILVISDKSRAQKHRWRIRESTLFLAGALGGVPGVYLTMLKIRHKTKHKRFMLGLPLIFAAQIALAVFVCLRLHLF